MQRPQFLETTCELCGRTMLAPALKTTAGYARLGALPRQGWPPRQGTRMIVEARVVGQPRTITDRELQLDPNRMSTLRDLIRELVAQELAGFSRRQRGNSLLRVITPADLARGVETGRYVTGRRDPQQAPPSTPPSSGRSRRSKMASTSSSSTTVRSRISTGQSH